MATSSNSRLIMLCFHVFISLTCVSALMACSDPKESKVVTRHGRNGNGGGGGKPTPVNGVAVTANSAVAFIAIKQLSRSLDIVLVNEKSLALHNCQKLSKTNTDKIDTITIVTDRDRCRDDWSAEEEFTVTYDDNKRDDLNKIASIVKKKALNIRVKSSDSKNNVNISRDITLDELTMTFTRLKDSLFSFEYKAELLYEIEVSRNRSYEDKSNNLAGRSKKHSISLAATGIVDIAKSNWQIVEIQSDIEGLKLNNTITPESLTTSYNLACGLPVGNLDVTQNIKTNGKPLNYKTAITIDKNGMITTPNDRNKYDSKGCAPGLQDLEDTLVNAFDLMQNSGLRSLGISPNSNRQNFGKRKFTSPILNQPKDEESDDKNTSKNKKKKKGGTLNSDQENDQALNQDQM